MISFKDIELKDKELITSYTQQSPRRNCDLSFSNLCSWRFLYDTQFAVQDGFLILKFWAGEKLVYMMPVGSGDLKKVLEDMIEDANLEGVVKSAVNGKTLVSTIDLNVQNILQKYIDEWQNSVGSHVTAAIAMDPNNGEVLGMATSNKFDLNDPRNTDGFSEEELMALGKKEAVGVYHRENPDQTITEDQALELHC